MSQIHFAVKELSRLVAKLTEKDRGRLRKLVRFFKGCPRYADDYGYQQVVGNLVVWADTDFAGCKKGRKSTSGGMLTHGGHAIKSWRHQSSYNWLVFRRGKVLWHDEMCQPSNVSQSDRIGYRSGICWTNAGQRGRQRSHGHWEQD